MCCITLKGFCGLSLPTASIVIGWLSSIISMIQSIACIAILFYLDEIARLAYSRFANGGGGLEPFGILFCVCVSLYLGVSVLDLVASALVIMGTHKKSHLMLLPWLINNMFALVVRFPFNFRWISSLFSKSDIPVGAALFLLAFWGAHCWIWTVIYSHFKEMRKAKDMPLELNQKAPGNNYEQFKSPQIDAKAPRY